MKPEQLIDKVESILDQRKSQLTAWANQPSSQLFWKAKQLFEEAEKEIRSLLEKELPSLQK